MHERTQERQDLQEELTALRRQARDAERVGPRRVQLHWALQAVRRDQDAGQTPRLHGVQDESSGCWTGTAWPW